MTLLQPTLFGEVFNPLNAWLTSRFPEVEMREFYRDLFPAGSLERQGALVPGKYRGVAVRIRNGRARRFSISDGLEVLDAAAQSTPEEFWLASPVSYAGRSQRQEMARHLYAVAIDLDGVRIENEYNPRGLGAMWNQIDHYLQPRPTFIVSSGSGLHMYYLLEEPLAMYRNVVRQLQRFRHDLIRTVWSSFVTELWERPQFESVTQGFRMVGTCTKTGDRVRAWRTGSPVSIEYLNDWMRDPRNQVTDIHYKSELSLAEAKAKYPDWYQRRIVEGRPRGNWEVKRALYDWWRDQKLSEAKTGHRYFYLMSLAIYAMKCGISEDELRRDAWNAVTVLRTQDQPGNPLLDDDVEKALEMYNASYMTFPRRSIAAITGIPIPPNKRNYRKQSVHLRGARSIQQIDCEVNGTDWRYHGGAPTKRDLIQNWRAQHPEGRKIDCEKQLGVSRHTVLRWWE